MEDNPALEIPEKYRVLGKNERSLRLTSPLLDSRAFAEEFTNALLYIMRTADTDEAVDALVIDGLSEFDLMFETTGTLDGYQKWEELLEKFFSIMTLAHHDSMKCPVIMTARVAEKRSARMERGKQVSAGDPGFMNFDYYPSIRGSFRLNLPHAFSAVFYLETEERMAEEGPYQGQMLPYHIVNMTRSGKFYVKNQWEHKWLKAGLPLRLANTKFPKLWERLQSLSLRTEE